MVRGRNTLWLVVSVCLVWLCTCGVELRARAADEQQAAPSLQAAPEGPTDAANEGSIEGTVVDAVAGLPLPDVEVTLAIRSRYVQRLRSDAKGGFRFEHLAPRGYSLVISFRSGYYGPGAQVALQAGQHVTGLQLRLRRTAVIAGRVLDTRRRPVRGVSVKARQPQYDDGRPVLTLRSATTNDLGEYRISNVSPGPYYVVAEPKSFDIRSIVWTAAEEEKEVEPVLAYARTYFPNSPDKEGAVPVNVTPGVDLEEIDIILFQERTVCVRSRISALEIGAGTGVSCMIEEAVPFGGSLVANGRLVAGQGFEVCGIPPGSYRFRASQLGAPAEPHFASELFYVVKRAIRLPDIHLRPLIEVRGELTIEDGKVKTELPAPVLIELDPKDRSATLGEKAFVRLDRMGPFIIASALPDEYWLRVRPPTGFYVKSATMAGTDVWRNPLHAAAGELRIVLGSDGPSLSGQVIDKENAAVGGAVVVLGATELSVPLAPRELLSQTTDYMGRFSFSGMAPGEYRLLAFTELGGYESENPDFFRDNRSKGVSVTLAPNERRTLNCTAIGAR